MTLSALLVFALALIIAAGTPGPSIAALIARVLTNGFRDVLPFLAAMWLGEALWLTCAVAGLAVIARSFGTVFIVLKFIGVGYLLFLAWKMWRAPTDVKGSELPRGPAHQPRQRHGHGGRGRGHCDTLTLNRAALAV